MSDTVQQIKDRLSITDVVGQYVKLERAGQNLRARCPFHAERTPSFMISPERGTYHCFGCGVGGDIFTFVEAIEGIDFKGALKVLAEKAGVPLVYERGEKGAQDEKERLFTLLETATIFYSGRLTDEAKKYLRNRGLTDATMQAFRLGWAGNSWSEGSDFFRGKKFSEKEIVDAGLAKKNERGSLVDKFRNRIMFPIADSAGRVIGFSGRTFGPDASPEAPKYLNSPEGPLFHKSRVLYGFDKAKISMRKLNCAVLVEGQMDLLLSHQAGWGNTVAVSGTAFTPEHATLLKRMTENLVIALDADEAGIKAASRAARSALQTGLNVKMAQLPHGLDPADFILKNGADAWKTAIRDAKDIVEFLLDVLAEKLMPPTPSQSDGRPTNRGSDSFRQPDRFRRAVEAAVLPFLQDTQSPIAREQYVRLVAHRLGVSEAAVSEALATLPQQAVGETVQQKPDAPAQNSSRGKPSSAQGSGRARQLFGILLWQESLAAPQLDAKKLARDLAEGVGKENFALLRALPEHEKEALRFGAERLYGERSPRADAEHLLRLVLHEKLSQELVAATAELKRAEAAGRGEEAAALLERSRLLTARIAQLHAEG